MELAKFQGKEVDDLIERVGHVGVLLGGRSRERNISLRSGEAIYQALKQAGFHASKIDTANGFLRDLKRHRIDFAFPALHGTGGEDGTIQGVLEHRGVPYVGSGPKASALAFDKLAAKRLFIQHEIPTPRFQVVTRKNGKRIASTWFSPCVLKPFREGSSIDVVVLQEGERVDRPLERFLKKYPAFLIEDKIEGREFTVAVVGKQALPVIEIQPKRAFYDYQAKYTKGLTRYLVPAPIHRSLERRILSVAMRAHGVLGVRDMARVDLIVDRREYPFVLEVNSIPGFTETSLLPKAAQQAGLNFTELCVYLIGLAVKRCRRQPRPDRGAER